MNPSAKNDKEEDAVITTISSEKMVESNSERNYKDIPASLKEIPVSSSSTERLKTLSTAVEGDGTSDDNGVENQGVAHDKTSDSNADQSIVNIATATAVSASINTTKNEDAGDLSEEKPPEGPPKKKSRKRWKKPIGKPSRPLSAYNLYFRKERAIMLGDDAAKNEHQPGKKRVHRKSHGKIAFGDMARIIGKKWKALSDEEKVPFATVAAVEKERYAKELATWRDEQKTKAIADAMGSGGRNSNIRNGTTKASIDSDDNLVGSIAEERRRLIRQHQMFRMQVMQEMQAGHLAGLPIPGMVGDGRSMPSIDYLRTMQDERATAYYGRNQVGNLHPYPSAAESSARNLFQSMSAIGSASGGFGPSMIPGPDGPGRESNDMRQLQLARMQMVNKRGGGNFEGSSGPMPGSYGPSGMMGFGYRSGIYGPTGPASNATMGNMMGTDGNERGGEMILPSGGRSDGGGGGVSAPFGSQMESQQQINRQSVMGGTGASNVMNNAMGGAMRGGDGAGFGMGVGVGNNILNNNTMGMTLMNQFEQSRFNPDSVEAMRRFQQHNHYGGDGGGGSM